MTANAAKRLLQHYVDNFRRLPWRSGPGEAPPDPYRVWLSEVMLQQTTVAAVAPRFERFVARWPTIAELAAAPDEAILSEWAGLGYYARARNLIACAREVVRRGGFPTNAAELRTLPGIGDYTAAAIAAIAFGEAVPVVDTNVRRVAARLHALAEPDAARIAAIVGEMTPRERPGDFAQAMMDLGATVCRPKAPQCASCPLTTECAAASLGTPESFPAKKPKRVRPSRHGTVWWIERNGAVWLVRRPPTGLLGGMPSLPGSEWSDQPEPTTGAELGRIRHVFTHFSLDLRIERRSAVDGHGWWQPIDSLEHAGLPTLYRRAVDVVLSGRDPAATGTRAAA